MRSIVLCLLMVATFVSCDSNATFHKYEALPQSWDKDRPVQFTVETIDSLERYNMFIHIRNNNSYPYSNLFLITKINFPNGKVIADTLEYEMARPDGSWLGVGFGSVKESKVWWKENSQFFEEGVYTFQIEHAMRNNGEVEGVSKLEGVTDVGVSIEKTQ